MKKLWVCLLCAVGTMSVPPTFAAEMSAIEEVVVTATKREESVQEIPIAVSAYSGEDLDARGVKDLYGLQEVSP